MYWEGKTKISLNMDCINWLTSNHPNLTKYEARIVLVTLEDVLRGRMAKRRGGRRKKGMLE